jgi:hypothetical protein
MSLPSPEQLEALGYLQLPPQDDYEASGVPLATYQMALRLRNAEGKLAAIAAHCRKYAYGASLSEVMVCAGDILAIIGSENAALRAVIAERDGSPILPSQGSDERSG